MPQIRVNVRTLVDNASIRKETRNGRAVIIVPSATLPDDIIMNRICYPAAEIKKSFLGLEGTLAPLGHPQIGNKLISAKSPEGLAAFYCGAHNENVRQEGGRVLLDKVIDVETAKGSDRGLSVLNAIEKGEPIHTSTGIYMKLAPADDQALRGNASGMVFDHDCILIGEAGAATPSQGVGMMVNGDGNDEECEVVNSHLEDFLEAEIDHLGQRMMRVIEEDARQDAWAAVRNRVVSAVRSALQSTGIGNNSITNNQSEDVSMIKDEEFAALQAQVKTLVGNADSMATGIAEAIKNALDPVVKSIETLNANAKAIEDAKREGFTKSLIASGLLTEDDCKSMNVNALSKLADKIKPGSAANLAGNFDANEEKDPFAKVDLNANIDSMTGAKKADA